MFDRLTLSAVMSDPFFLQLVLWGDDIALCFVGNILL